MVIYIGMFGLVAKAEVLANGCNGKWTVKILEIIKQSSKDEKYKMKDIEIGVGDVVRLAQDFIHQPACGTHQFDFAWRLEDDLRSRRTHAH